MSPDPSSFQLGKPFPLVSVAITSFQSERWLAEALSGVLQQNVAFAVEIVIGDDCSSDGTLAVARSFERLHPGVVRVLERKARVGMQRNYYETFEHCRGRYIAWLDADDYWTDPLKLSTQVAILDSDPTIAVCTHFVRTVTAAREVLTKRSPVLAPGRYGLCEIVRRNFVPSPSILFRNGAHRALPDSYFSLPNIADWPLLVEAALVGDIFLIENTMADYRLTPGSAYSSTQALERERIDSQLYDYLDRRLPLRFRKVIKEGRGESYLELAYDLRHAGNFRSSRNAALKAMRVAGVNIALRTCTSVAGTLVAQVRSLIGHRNIESTSKK